MKGLKHFFLIAERFDFIEKNSITRFVEATSSVELFLLMQDDIMNRRVTKATTRPFH